MPLSAAMAKGKGKGKGIGKGPRPPFPPPDLMPGSMSAPLSEPMFGKGYVPNGPRGPPGMSPPPSSGRPPLQGGPAPGPRPFGFGRPPHGRPPPMAMSQGNVHVPPRLNQMPRPMSQHNMPPPPHNGMRQQSQKVRAEVILNLYDWKSNNLVLGLNDFACELGAGAFHAAVEVYGVEWSYSQSAGIFPGKPRGNENYEFRESIPMGVINLSPQQVETLLHDMGRTDWDHQDYLLLYHNCVHFADDFCYRLGVGSIPTWVNNPFSKYHPNHP